jgi:hypothetical protein
MFEVEVVSDPAIAYSTRGRVLNEDYAMITSYDEALVKPALLVADRVRLTTMRRDMVQFESAGALANSRMPMRYILAFASLSRYGSPEDLASANLQRQDLAETNDADTLLDMEKFDIARLEAFAQKYDEQIFKYQSAFAAILRKRVADLNSTGLTRAKELGLLEETSWYGGDLSIKDLVWTAGVNEYLTDAVRGVADRIVRARGSVLLEPGAIKVFGVDEPSVRDPTQTPSGLDISAALATVVTGRLPGLTGMPLDEVFDMRESLRDYLDPFRAAMAQLADDIASTDDSPSDLTHEVERRWVREIAPSLSEMRASLSQGSYRRNLLSSFAEDKATIATSGSSIALGIGSIFAGLGALIPAAATAAFPFVRALNETLKAKDEVRKNRLYFLYQAQRQTNRYA